MGEHGRAIAETPLLPEHVAVPPRVTRRRWLKRSLAATVAVGAGVVIDTFWVEPHWLEIVRRDLPVDRLPAHWHGRTLMQISDVHVSDRVSDDGRPASRPRLSS